MMEEPRIPPINSQQYLVVNDDQETTGNSRQIKRSESTERVITAREWATVLVLCFVNLINYMDRTTIAGMKILSQFWSGLLVFA